MSTTRLQDYFVELMDLRRRATTLSLMEIVVVSLSAVSCGSDNFVIIATQCHPARTLVNRS